MIDLVLTLVILVVSYFYHFLAMHIIRPVQIKAKRCSSTKKTAFEWLAFVIGVVFIVVPCCLYIVFIANLDFGFREDVAEWVQIILMIAYGATVLPAYIDNDCKVNSKKADRP